MPVAFFDAIAKEFGPDALSGGLSIFHAGGVRKFEYFGELTQAEIRAGLGEYFRVHAKFHQDGRGIQWMDCSCRDNRRRGARCAHLAAFLIFIDENQQPLLRKFSLSGGQAEDRIMALSERLSRDSISNLLQGEPQPELSPSGLGRQPSSTETTAAPEPAQVLASLTVTERTGPAALQLPTGMSLKNLSHGREPGILLATVARSDGREIKYRLGVDDSLALLDWGPALATMSERLRLERDAAYEACRVFRVTRPRKGLYQIDKAVVVRRRGASTEGSADSNGQTQESGPSDSVIIWEDIPRLHLGRNGLYLRKFGFIRFADSMDPARETRWADYPSTAQIDSEVAAGLFHTRFERLRQTAEVVLDPALQHLTVIANTTLGPMDVTEGPGGNFLIQTKLIAKPDAVLDHGSMPSGASTKRDEGVPSLTLLDIVSARKAGRSFIETKEGWIKVNESFDWLSQRLDGKGRLQLSKLEFIRFHESVGREHAIRAQGNTVARLCEGLVSQDSLEPPQLSHTKLSLRPYQQEGYRWLWWLYENELGGLLADEMGLGKTHQAMALIAAIQGRDPAGPPTLVVCPTTVMDHWHDKISEFLPHVKLFNYYGAGRALLPRGSGHLVVLTSYGILLRDIQELAAMPWAAVILDEAHLVKNQTTRTYHAACQIRSRIRICLTGTPLENDLFELKTLFDWIVPGYLGPDTAFRKRYVVSVPHQAPDPLATVELKRLIHPFKMRRTKAEVLTDLPEKVEEIRYCTLSAPQRALYEQALQLKGRPLIDELSASDGPVPYVHVFAVLTFLKQICNDPGLVHPDYEGVASGKMDMLDEILAEATESNQKVVIFSQYARMVNRLSKHLDRAGIRHVCLTGQSTQRGATVAAFQNDPDIRVFVGSLLAGGTGIDLTAASIVIHFDRWWNAAKENQATDRIHRIGQQRNVQVFKMITRGTVEEHIDRIIAQKRATFEQYVEEDPQAFRNLTREDLLKLFMPITTEPLDTSEPDSDTSGGSNHSPGGPSLAEPTHGAQDAKPSTLESKSLSAAAQMEPQVHSSKGTSVEDLDFVTIEALYEPEA